MEETDDASVERPIDPRQRTKPVPGAPVQGAPADQTPPYGEQPASQSLPSQSEASQPLPPQSEASQPARPSTGAPVPPFEAGPIGPAPLASPPLASPGPVTAPPSPPAATAPSELREIAQPPRPVDQSPRPIGASNTPAPSVAHSGPPAGIPYEDSTHDVDQSPAPFAFDGPVKSPGGGLSRGFLVGAVLLVVIIGGAAGALLARGGGDSKDQSASATTSAESESADTPATTTTAVEPSVPPTTVVAEQDVEPSTTQPAEELDRELRDSDRFRSVDEASPDFEATDENAFLTDVHYAADDGLVAIGYVDDVPAVWSWTPGSDWDRELISLEGANGAESSIYQVAATGSVILINGDHDAETSFLWSNQGAGWVVDLEEKGETYDVLAGERGFLSVGERQGVATVWSSENGSTWSGGTALPVSDDAFYSTVIDVCRCADGFLATGVESREDGSSVAVWRSDDGQRWSRIPHSPDLVLLNEEDGWGYGAAQLGGSIVVVGIDGDLEPTIWLASGGERFSRLDLDPDIFSSEEGDELYGITSDGRRAIAYGTNSAGDAKAWLSVDGATWEIVEGIFNPRSGPISSIIYRDGVFVLAGSTWAISHWIPEVWYIE